MTGKLGLSGLGRVTALIRWIVANPLLDGGGHDEHAMWRVMVSSGSLQIAGGAKCNLDLVELGLSVTREEWCVRAMESAVVENDG